MDEKKQREQYVSGYTSNDKLAIIKNPSPKRRILNKEKKRKQYCDKSLTEGGKKIEISLLILNWHNRLIIKEKKQLHIKIYYTVGWMCVNLYKS